MRSTGLVLMILVCGVVFAGDAPLTGDLPDGWRRGDVVALAPDQVQGLSARFGGKIESIENLHFAHRGRACQVNRIVCATESDARAVEAKLIEFKGDPSQVRRDANDPKVVLELYCRDASLLTLAKTTLGFQPEKQTYRVEFTAVPLEKIDFQKWNPLFNLFLEYDGTPDEDRRAEVEARIRALTQGVEFGRTIRLRSHGQGAVPIRATFSPAPESVRTSDDGAHRFYEFGELPKKAGLPVVRVTLEVESHAGAATPGQAPTAADRGVTQAWPIDSKVVRELAKSVTESASTDSERVDAILRWMSDPKNLRYGGEVVGSRYGVEQTISQKYGRCWDYSDVFVTLCRASGVPSRQVLGWLDGVSGHVWAEVYVEGEGWRAVDPTGVPPCGSHYIPYFGGADGSASFAYASGVDVRVLPTPPRSEK